MMALLASACSGEKKARISSKCPTGDNEIVISGSKINFAEPWLTSFIVKGGDTLMAPTTQIFSKDISPEFVKISWKGKDQALVEFLQTDDTKRIFKLSIKNKLIGIKEVNSIQDDDDDWETGLKVK